MKQAIVPSVLVTFGSLLVIAMFFMTDWDRPPVESTQIGYRGTAMQQIVNPRVQAKVQKANEAPPPPYELTTGGDRAGSVYKNVQVLADVPSEQFDRLMAAITEWVAPEEQGCNYCHNPEDMASDEVYAKNVARRMLQMTRHINQEQKDHVAATGVTCYTCHRGNPVPANVWVQDSGPKGAGGFTYDRGGQNLANASVGLTSMVGDPFSTLLADAKGIKVQATTALPAGTMKASTQSTETTYALMIHMSSSLGVGCTYCHNSQNFANREQSTPARMTAWHGLRMVSGLNDTFVSPLAEMLPAERLGPNGDAPKVACATCHQGANKPLLGAAMAKDYPALGAAQ
jgi:photosynthetic reaction center cytochrome c subunit